MTYYPVLFLDIDGVFSTSRCLLEDYDEDDPSLLFVRDLCPDVKEFIVPLEKSYILNLKWILDAQPVHFVISSTWRQCDNYKNFFLAALRECGIDTSRYIGDTPTLSAVEGRGAEIRQWLSENSHVGEHFVIIDDDHEVSFKHHGLDKHWVQTIMRSDNPTEEGFSPQQAQLVMTKLHSFL